MGTLSCGVEGIGLVQETQEEEAKLRHSSEGNADGEGLKVGVGRRDELFNFTA